jgi:hypothetical protein
MLAVSHKPQTQMRMKKKSAGRKAGMKRNSRRATKRTPPGRSLARANPEGIGSTEESAGGAPEFVASIHAELERWRKRFAQGEPMFVRGDIKQPEQLSARLLAGKGSMAEVLRDGYRTWIEAGGCEPEGNPVDVDLVEDAMVSYFNEIMSGADLLRMLCGRVGLDCQWSEEGLAFVPFRSVFDYPEDPDEPDTSSGEEEDRRHVDSAIARAKQAWKDQGFPSAEAEPSLLEYVVGFPLGSTTKKALLAKYAPELLPFRNRQLINDAFPEEVSPDLIRDVVPTVFVWTSPDEGCEVERIEAIGASGVAIYMKGGRRPHVRFRDMMIQHYSQTIVHFAFIREPAPMPEIGFHTGFGAR